jgi:hypothetical protein
MDGHSDVSDDVINYVFCLSNRFVHWFPFNDNLDIIDFWINVDVYHYLFFYDDFNVI